MIYFLKLQERIPNVRRSTTLSLESESSNRVAICSNGIKGYINRSGACFCDESYFEMILAKKLEVEEKMKSKFGDHFKALHLVTNKLNNPAMQAVRDAYYKH